jgi:CRP/FNR family transcriptional regulator, anaerobic regulatory protein
MTITDLPGIKALLQRYPRLQSICEPEWDAALLDATLERIPRSTSFSGCRESFGDRFAVVLEGAIKVRCVSQDGRTLSIYRVKGGELCMLSLAALHLQGRVVMEMSTVGEVLLLKIPMRHFARLLSHSALFRAYLMSSMFEHMAILINRIEETTFSCLQSRILRHLQEAQVNSGCSLIPMSHQELADELGSTREAISRVLKEMERCGLVKLGRRTISLAMAPPTNSSRCEAQLA